MNPIVSVCVLSQNHEEFIEDLMLSLSRQTEQCFEIIYIDNCSNDNSYLKTLTLASDYGLNLAYSCKNNVSKNIPTNLNHAIINAKADLILIISADDWLTDNSLEKKVRFLKNNPDVVAVSSAVTAFYQADGRLEQGTVSSAGSANQFEELLEGNISFNAPGALYRKKALQEAGMFDERINVEDYDMWLKLSLLGKIGVISEPLAFYRRHSSNASIHTKQKFKWMAESIFRTLKKYKNHPKYESAIRKLYLRIFQSHFQIASPSTALAKARAMFYVLSLGKRGLLATLHFIIFKMKSGFERKGS